MFVMTEFSSAVRTRRSDMGLTQTALAGLSGLSRATINQLENGTLQDLSLTRVARLLGVLGLSVHVTAPRAKSHRLSAPPTLCAGPRGSNRQCQLPDYDQRRAIARGVSQQGRA